MPGNTALIHAHAAGVTILPGPDNSLRVAPSDRITPELRHLLAKHKEAVLEAATPQRRRQAQVYHRGEWITFHHDAALPGEPIEVTWTRGGKAGRTTIPNTSRDLVDLAERIQNGATP